MSVAPGGVSVSSVSSGGVSGVDFCVRGGVAGDAAVNTPNSESASNAVATVASCGILEVFKSVSYATRHPSRWRFGVQRKTAIASCVCTLQAPS